jgi:TIR domain-containing protein
LKDFASGFEMSNSNPEYDVFISYKSEYKPWVETLARNLERQRLTVWLDDWRKRPGDLIAGTLDKAIKSSRAGVLVVTPEAVASGWVQEEYESMLAREKKGGFQLIPAILRKSEGFPFLRNRFWIDFTAPEHYPRRLYELVQGVQGLEADPEGAVSGEIEPPPPLPDIATLSREGELKLFKSVFRELDDVGVMLLFAQEGMAAGGSDLLVQEAKQRYGATNVFHVVPIVCGEEEAEGYFLDIARQLGISPLKSAGALSWKLPELLANRRKLLLVLTNFENGPRGARHSLSSALRTFYQQEPNKVRLIVRGGEQLAELRYEAGDVSLLNLAGARLWPELTGADVDWLFDQYETSAGLKAGEAAAILRATGGEPRLVARCLRDRTDAAPDGTIDYDRIVAGHDIATSWFVPFNRNNSDAAKARRLLKETDHGVYAAPWFSDAVKRRLFWKNALAVREVDGVTRLHWRYDALRETGRGILECED